MTIEINCDLLPSEYADELGLQYSSSVRQEHKKKLGQYFTPKRVASYMASQYTPSNDKSRLRVLDPGSGLGVLSCALCEHIASLQKIHEIDLVVFETDLALIDQAYKVFDYLQEWLRSRDINFNYFLCANDFILHNSSVLKGEENPADFFDVIITNPPYFKLSKNDPLTKVTRNILSGQQNIYSIFIYLTVKFLTPGGTLIFISPRSFTSGHYFREFRDFVFQELKFEKIHLFHSRKKVFSRDKVLQENLIVCARKRSTFVQGQIEMPINLDEISISMSQGVEDITTVTVKKYLVSDLINFDSYQKIFHIPVSKRDDNAIALFRRWNNSFSKSKIKISTGPVVSFRAIDFVVKDNEKNSVPLIWLNNVSKMNLKWPIVEITDQRPQYIVEDEQSQSLLVDNQNMIIIRRFSSKDDSSRLVAAPFFKSDFKYSRIGLENHVNYLYGLDEPLSDLRVWGITSLLNSSLFDIYFRTFNGNINVSATELRELPLPDMEIILELGAAVSRMKDFNQEKLDALVDRAFELTN